MAAKHPFRVLCLAGFRQSERAFREKTGALRKALRGRAELVCLSGPHPVVDKAGAEGIGPESGETSSTRKCAPSFYFLVLITPVSIPQTLYRPSCLPLHLPILFIFSIAASQASTLIYLSSLSMPLYSPPHLPQTVLSPLSRLSLSFPNLPLPFPLLFPWIPPCPNLILSSISL